MHLVRAHVGGPALHQEPLRALHPGACRWCKRQGEGGGQEGAGARGWRACLCPAASSVAEAQRLRLLPQCAKVVGTLADAVEVCRNSCKNPNCAGKDGHACCFRPWHFAPPCLAPVHLVPPPTNMPSLPCLRCPECHNNGECKRCTFNLPILSPKNAVYLDALYPESQVCAPAFSSEQGYGGIWGGKPGTRERRL